MRDFRKVIVVGSAVFTLSVASLTVFAAAKYSTPAEAVAGLTGRTVEDVREERQETGKTYGTIANEAGKLEEFKEENLQVKKEILEERVKDGNMTQSEADALIAEIEENMEECDGTGNGMHLGRGSGAGFGSGSGSGLGRGSRGAGNRCEVL